MSLIQNKSYFVSTRDVVLRKNPSKKSTGLNHLIYGDWMKFLGETDNGWAKIRSRGKEGWIPITTIQEERVLEINFVDIGIGDGCHIVTPNDDIILIDAGKTDNMSRFINWRYNIRDRQVKGVDDVPIDADWAKDPKIIDYVIISHPDKDHYYGFKDLFENKKFAYKKVFHNGIFERPKDSANEDPNLHYYSSEDLGGYVTLDSKKFLWDTVNTNAEMHTLIKRYKSSNKDYLKTLNALISNNPDVKFTTLSIRDKYLDKFNSDSSIPIKILGPVTEKVKHLNKSKDCLIRLKDEGKTKNGHSIVLKLHIDKLRVLLGGDLNTQSEDYLLKHYTNTEKDVSKLENSISKLVSKGITISKKNKQKLLELQTELESIIIKGRGHFESDITKACHHGSHHFSESFLKCLNSIVTVISSGDNDSYAHPRPDALGAFGKYGRGERPLIFSTEIGRSTAEFTHVEKYFEEISQLKNDIANEPSKREKKKIRKRLEKRKDRNVAVYGMITVRTNGDKVYIAQKLEASSDDQKWDIHELRYNEARSQFEYIEKH
ncbi:SH3 domain-containing protein [Kordia sp.]|uniref:SH3 domain-containing protein n=1 Tax=Kordia sp. TaxID=1965332 RepID=UPI003D6C00A5